MAEGRIDPIPAPSGCLKTAPWEKLSSVLKHKDVYQYLKFMVEYKRLQPGSKIVKEASQMQKYELWLHAGLTPSMVRVDIMKKNPGTKLKVLLQNKYFGQYAKFMVEYQRLHPNGVVSFV